MEFARESEEGQETKRSNAKERERERERDSARGIQGASETHRRDMRVP